MVTELTGERVLGDRKPRVLWLYGSTGVGKSREAQRYAERLGCSRPHRPISGRWLAEGYDGEATVAIIEDIRDGWIQFDRLLTLWDHYPTVWERKGSTSTLPTIQVWIVTCPVAPEAIFRGRDATGGDAARDDIGQLLRRIDVTIDFDADGAVLHMAALAGQLPAPRALGPDDGAEGVDGDVGRPIVVDTSSCPSVEMEETDDEDDTYFRYRLLDEED